MWSLVRVVYLVHVVQVFRVVMTHFTVKVVQYSVKAEFTISSR